MAHTERRQREKADQKQAIMNAAVAIAAKEGWQAVTIRRIADVVEYAPPIIYEYFKNKEDLFRELIYKGFRLLHDEYQNAKGEEQDPKKLLYKLSLTHWIFAETNKELYQLMFDLERPLPSEEMKKNFSLILDIFLQLSDNKEEDADILMLSWIIMNHGAISFLMQLPPPPEKFKNISLFELYKKVITRFISSI
jgi:AcrR family transcriptional regulator